MLVSRFMVFSKLIRPELVNIHINRRPPPQPLLRSPLSSSKGRISDLTSTQPRFDVHRPISRPKDAIVLMDFYGGGLRHNRRDVTAGNAAEKYIVIVSCGDDVFVPCPHARDHAQSTRRRKSYQCVRANLSTPDGWSVHVVSRARCTEWERRCLLYLEQPVQ